MKWYIPDTAIFLFIVRILADVHSGEPIRMLLWVHGLVNKRLISTDNPSNKWTRGRVNLKMLSYQHGNLHYKDKTVSRAINIYEWNPSTYNEGPYISLEYSRCIGNPNWN